MFSITRTGCGEKGSPHPKSCGFVNDDCGFIGGRGIARPPSSSHLRGGHQRRLRGLRRRKDWHRYLPPHNDEEFFGGRGTGPLPHNNGVYVGGGGTGSPPHIAGEYFGGRGTVPLPHNVGAFHVFLSTEILEEIVEVVKVVHQERVSERITTSCGADHRGCRRSRVKKIVSQNMSKQRIDCAIVNSPALQVLRSSLRL